MKVYNINYIQRLIINSVMKEENDDMKISDKISKIYKGQEKHFIFYKSIINLILHVYKVETIKLMYSNDTTKISFVTIVTI
jgi:hypothetical protein